MKNLIRLLLRNRSVTKISILLGLSAGGVAYSTDYSWNNSNSTTTSWFTPGNWSPGGPPTASDIVVNPTLYSDAVIFGNNAAVGGINLTNLTSGWTITNTQASTTRTLTVNGNVAKAGAGNLSFRNNAVGAQLNVAITGTLTLSSGNMLLGAFGAGQDINAFNVTGLTTVSGGTLLTRGTNSAINLNGGLSISSGAVVSASGMGAATSGTTGFTTAFLSGAGQLKANNGNAFNGTVVINGSTGSSTFSGQVIDGSGGSGVLSIVKSGGSTQVFSGNNSYTGGTAINGGTLALGSANAVGTTGSITFGGGTLQFSANNTTDYSARIVNSTAGAIAIDTNGHNVSFGALGSSNTGGLTKNGTGTLTLTGNNTYTGSTTVTSGTLLVSSGAGIGDGAVAVNGGSLTVNGSVGNGGVTINSGGSLGGNGSIAGNVTLNGGTLAPGNSPGLLSVGSLTLSSGTTAFEINGTGRGTTFDAIDVANGGGVQFGGAFTLSFGSLLADSTTLDLFSFNTGSTGDFSSVVSTGSYASAGWIRNGLNDTWTLNTGSQTLVFSEATGDLQVIPEPATWALLALGLTLAVTLRRRRNADLVD